MGAPIPEGDGAIWLATGIAPVGVELVRVSVGDYGVEAEVEPVTGAFIAALPVGRDEWPAVPRAEVSDRAPPR